MHIAPPVARIALKVRSGSRLKKARDTLPIKGRELRRPIAKYEANTLRDTRVPRALRVKSVRA